MVWRGEMDSMGVKKRYNFFRNSSGGYIPKGGADVLVIHHILLFIFFLS